MSRDLTLKSRLEKAGLIVMEVAGWQTRGTDDLIGNGSVNHHTAGPRAGVSPSLGVIINGRGKPGDKNYLPGPLANVHGPREESMRVNLVAAGKANHAGLGGYAGNVGNSSVYGLEEEHTGYATEPISEMRIERMARVHAAFAYGHFTPQYVCQHWEWAPTRKIDFVKGMLDVNDFRNRVGRILTEMATGTPAPGPTPPPTPGADSMIASAKNADGRLEIFRVTAYGTVQHAWQGKVNGPLGAWVDMPGATKIAHGITAVTDKDGRIEIFAYDVDWNVFTAWQLAPNGGWSGWTRA